MLLVTEERKASSVSVEEGKRGIRQEEKGEEGAEASRNRKKRKNKSDKKHRAGEKQKEVLITNRRRWCRVVRKDRG